MSGENSARARTINPGYSAALCRIRDESRRQRPHEPPKEEAEWQAKLARFGQVP